MRSPILFLIFNRPEVTQRVFEAIRNAKPPKLYIAADGPREHKQGEKECCEAVLDIVSHVDWPCEVHHLFRQNNLGCKLAISGAIDWFFSNESEGIILEDDCLPDPSFFLFCDELLERYRDDERVGMISGSNLQGGVKRGDYSYYFSHFYHIWGWATWARAWNNYDVAIRKWPELKQMDWLGLRGFKGAQKQHWKKEFDKIFDGNLDTWDHQWTMCLWVNNMLCIAPNINLISNIGFGADATHTIGRSVFADLKRDQMQFPLSHPSEVIRNEVADNYSSNNLFTSSYIVRGLRKLKAIFLK